MVAESAVPEPKAIGKTIAGGLEARNRFLDIHSELPVAPCDQIRSTLHERVRNSEQRTGSQQVAISATSENDTIDLGGNFQTLGFGDLATTEWRKNLKEFSAGGTGGEDTKGAIGATALVYFYENDVAAQIQDGVSLYSKQLDVTAVNGVLGVAVGASGGTAKDF